MKINLLVLTLFLCSSSSAITLSRNDVSILIPLPVAGDDELLWSPHTQGSGGEILPSVVYRQLPSMDGSPRKDFYLHLRVVSIRLDPCFPLKPPATGCQPQIRLVWQPIRYRFENATIDSDSALHTFYNLDESRLFEIFRKIALLNEIFGVVSPDGPLTVHPEISRRGLRSQYAQELLGTILSGIGAENLVKVAFMKHYEGDIAWTFGGLNLSVLEGVPFSIPRIGTSSQSLILTNQEGRLVIDPEPSGTDSFQSFWLGRPSVGSQPPAELSSLNVLTASHIEDPKMHSPVTVDCVSCHVAESERLSLEFGEKRIILRAFGYFGTTPAISRRTINETETIVKFLENFR